MRDNQQLQRERTLYDYLDAFEQGDIGRMQVILRYAERDRELSHMIQDVHAALDTEIQSSVSINSSKSHKQNGSNHMTTHALSYQDDPRHLQIKQRRSLPITLIATLAVTMLIGTVLLSMYFNLNDENRLLAPPAQEAESTQMELFQRYIDEVWNQADAESTEELVLRTHRITGSISSGKPNYGPAALLRIVEQTREDAFDLTFTIDNAIEKDNQIWAVLKVTNSQIDMGEGGLFTPSSGDQFVNSATMIVTFEENQIAETWVDLNYSNFFWEFLGQANIDETAIQEQQNIATVERIYDELWNNSLPRLADVHELYYRAFRVWNNLGDEATNTAPADYWRTSLVSMHNMMPDINVTIQSIAADGDQVMVHYTVSGTWTGAFCYDGSTPCEGPEAVPPTNESLSWTGTTVYRFRDDKVVEQWDYWDTSLLWAALDQIGVEVVWPEGE